MASSRRLCLRLPLLAALLLLGQAGAWAQRQAPAEIERVEVTPLSNAVRVALHANGIINVDTGPLWDKAWEPFGDGDWRPRLIRRVPIRLPNCRSRIGAFYDVASYPVSHIEISVRPDDTVGIGIDLELVLYQPASNMSYMLWDGPRDSGWPYRGLGYDVAIARDKRSVIFTVMNDRFPEKPVVRVQPGPERPERLSLDYADGKLSVSARYVPIRRLLTEIAARVGERILVEDGLERTVSLHLAGIGLREFLDALAEASGLACSRINGEWAVGEGVVTRAASYYPSETRRFPLKYLAPVDAVDLLPSFLLSYVHTDPEGNALVASGPERMLRKVAGDLAHIDVAPPQIEVTALAVESTSLRVLETAFEYGVGSRRVQGEVVPASGDLSYRRVAAPSADVAARIRALERRGALRVRAEPRVTVLNGRAAELFVGRQRFAQVSRPEWGGLEPELKAIPIGVSLSVTPWSGGGEITMEVSPEVTTIDEIDPETRLPVVGVSRSKANVRVAEGETVLISGLRIAQEEHSTRKVPLLGDLPLVGGLFRSRMRRDETTELAIFISAREVK